MHVLFFSAKRVHWMWQKKAATLLAERDVFITPARWGMLRTLYTYRHGICRGKLADLLGVAGPGVSRMVRALQDGGLVQRDKYDHDSRYVRIELTQAGREVVERALGEADGVSLGDAIEHEARSWFGSSKDPQMDLCLLHTFLVRARCRREDKAIYPVPWYGGEVNSWEPGVIAEPPPLVFVDAA